MNETLHAGGRKLARGGRAGVTCSCLQAAAAAAARRGAPQRQTHTGRLLQPLSYTHAGAQGRKLHQLEGPRSSGRWAARLQQCSRCLGLRQQPPEQRRCHARAAGTAEREGVASAKRCARGPLLGIQEVGRTSMGAGDGQSGPCGSLELLSVRRLAARHVLPRCRRHPRSIAQPYKIPAPQPASGPHKRSLRTAFTQRALQVAAGGAAAIRGWSVICSPRPRGPHRRCCTAAAPRRCRPRALLLRSLSNSTPASAPAAPAQHLHPSRSQQGPASLHRGASVAAAMAAATAQLASFETGHGDAVSSAAASQPAPPLRCACVPQPSRRVHVGGVRCVVCLLQFPT